MRETSRGFSSLLRTASNSAAKGAGHESGFAKTEPRGLDVTVRDAERGVGRLPGSPLLGTPPWTICLSPVPPPPPRRTPGTRTTLLVHCRIRST